MIRIDLEAEGPAGQWAYAVRGTSIEGVSRQPLLDACRQLNSTGDRTGQRAGLFRNGKSTPDLHCLVSVGAGLTVKEPVKGSISLRKFVPFEADLKRAA